MRYLVIGHIGSDAGYWYWDGHGWHHVGGWGIEQLREVRSALNIISESTSFKTPGLAEAATKTVTELVEKHLGSLSHVKQAAKEGTPLVIIA
jgi:hypothetical protein